MAKQRQDELAFGSDSFLDVVANIVGILIILIVVAGVKVSQAPKAPPVIAETETEIAEPILANAESEDVQEPQRVEIDPFAEQPISAMLVEEKPIVTPPEPVVFAPLPEVSTPQAIVSTIDDLTRKSQRLQEELRNADIAEQRLTQRRLATSEDAESLRKELTLTTEELHQQHAALATSLEVAIHNEQTIALLKQKVEEAEKTKPQKETLKHQLPPIGRLVTGKEVHFRLIDNQISRVPVDELGERMQRDIERRRDVIMARHMYRGTAGPLHGYAMNYVIQRQSMSLFEEAQHGRAVVRMGITGWVIQPSNSLVSEPYEEAIQRNSRFRNALLKAGSSSTITFWVYPDSFELHQQLKEYLQETGFWVATRPLPAGVPIAGSPQGSRSFAQ